jgi:hypothetical protein
MKRSPLDRIRSSCLALPEATERVSHGMPTFFVRDQRAFAVYSDHHHNDGRLAIVCAAPPGVQDACVRKDPRRYYVPPYVGTRGWIGLRLDVDPDWKEVAHALERAFRTVAPRRVLEQMDGQARQSASRRRK